MLKVKIKGNKVFITEYRCGILYIKGRRRRITVDRFDYCYVIDSLGTCYK